MTLLDDIHGVAGKVFPNALFNVSGLRSDNLRITMGRHTIEMVAEKGAVTATWVETKSVTAKSGFADAGPNATVVTQQIDHAVLNSAAGAIGWLSYIRSTLTTAAIETVAGALDHRKYMPHHMVKPDTPVMRAVHFLFDTCANEPPSVIQQMVKATEIVWGATGRGWGAPIRTRTRRPEKTTKSSGIALEPQGGVWKGRMRVPIDANFMLGLKHPGFDINHPFEFFVAGPDAVYEDALSVAHYIYCQESLKALALMADAYAKAKAWLGEDSDQVVSGDEIEAIIDEMLGD
jgi:hypothetical protein